MNTDEPSKIKMTNWLSVRNLLVRVYGIRESIANVIVARYKNRIERAKKFHRDSRAFTECLIKDLKEKNKDEEYDKLLDKDWRPPCKICGGIKVIPINDDEITDCTHCVDGKEPENIFVE